MEEVISSLEREFKRVYLDIEYVSHRLEIDTSRTRNDTIPDVGIFMKRLNELENKGIDVNFKGWYTGDTKHILLCPSSPTVTYHINGISQEDWINEVTSTLKQFTKREIRVRNKPRPDNQWWGTDIKDELKDCHCLVTNMSMAAIDAVMNMVPVICHTDNIVSPVASHDLKFIEKPLRSGRKTMNEWLKYVAENQFTLEEISNGIAYKTLKEQEING